MFRQLTFIQFISFLFTFLSITPTLVSTHVVPRRVPTPPSADSFYTPPAGYEASPPGTVLRSRTTPSPIAAFGLLPVPLAASYQLLYRSTDSFDKPTTTVTTVLVPLNFNPAKLLSYQIAQDSSYLNCAPSYALQQFSASGGLFGTIGSQVEILGIASALHQGWIVAVPDHEGPPAAFLANKRGGQAVLDGIRAVLSSSSITSIANEVTVTMWGYSGGSLVSAFAAELLPSYAPDLISSIAGVALGGTVPNITSSLPYINKSLFSGLLPGGILGLSHEYPAVAAALRTALRPGLWEALFRNADRQCLGANFIQFLGQDIVTTYFADTSIFSDPVIVDIQNENALGQQQSSVPTYIYKAVNDQVSPIADTDALYDFYCAAGSPSVEYRRDLTAEHAGLLIVGIPAAVQWLKGRMDGEVVEEGCMRTNVVSALTDGIAREILGDEIVNALQALAGLSGV